LPLIAISAAPRTGQEAIVYFISDLDPSGVDLQRAWVDALDNFFEPVHGDFVRIGLKPEQLSGLPPRLQQGIEVKPSDSRSRGFVAEYGARCWETDILPAATIEAALDAHVQSWLDADLWRRRDVEIERARKLL
jgi:hypothetical protein